MRSIVFTLAWCAAACASPDDVLLLQGSVDGPEPRDEQLVQLLRARSESDAGAVEHRRTLTTSDGTFEFELLRAETTALDPLGQFELSVVTTFPSGASARADFRMSEPLRLRPLREWQAMPAMVGELVTVARPPVVEAARWQAISMEVKTSDGAVAWRETMLTPPGAAATQSFRGTARVLEELGGVATFVAQSWEPDPADSVAFSTPPPLNDMHAAATLAFTGGRAPISRGLPCSAQPTPCVLTDGDPSPVPLATTSTTIELEPASQLSLVALRAVRGIGVLTLEVRRDDQSVETHRVEFPEPPVAPVGALRPGSDAVFSVVEVSRGNPVTHVTLTFEGLWSLGEVSLY